MFDKLIGGKKKREIDLFTLPQKKYTTDPKILSKMASKALLDVFHQQEKYIGHLVDKISAVRQDYERLAEKNDELQQKNEVVSSQIVRMTNEHEELTIKFDNLQNSLQFFSSEGETTLRKELQFLKEQEVGIDKLKNLSAVLALYREKFALCKKIQTQNKNLKGRYSELEEELEELQGKLKATEKDKNYNQLIPSLMEEIQALKSTNAHSHVEARVDQIQHQILAKVKNELETAQTLRNSQQEQELLQKQAQVEKLVAQLSQSQSQADSLKKQSQEDSAIMLQYSERLNNLEAEVESLRSQNKSIAAEMAKKQQECQASVSKWEGQASRVVGELTSLKEEYGLMAVELQQTKSVLSSVRQANLRMREEGQGLLVKLKSQQQELVRQKENRYNLEKTLSSKNNSQLDHLLTVKNNLERDVEQLKQKLEEETKRAGENQNKVKKLVDDNEILKVSLKRMEEEKLIIQDNVSNCLKIAQEEGEKYKLEITRLTQTAEDARKEAADSKKKVKECEEQVRNFTAQTEKLFRTVQAKDNELRKAYACSEQLEKEKGVLVQEMGVREEEEKVKGRKYQSELNQQRIKLESLNRKLSILESKGEESKVSMDGMYQQLLAKDKKISQMEIKLKQYKYKIQLLRKEKQDLENTYEHKLTHLQPQEQGLKLSTHSQEEEKTQRDKEEEEQRDLLKNELTSLQEQNKAILGENQRLREEVEETRELVKDKEKTIRLLQEKRDNIIKEIERMGKKNNPIEASSAAMMSPKQVPGENREKKIASKALKGFEIVLKLEHQFYKNFVGVFAQRLQDEHIKQLEKEINLVIKRSSDMKDVFEGYLE